MFMEMILTPDLVTRLPLPESDDDCDELSTHDEFHSVNSLRLSFESSNNASSSTSFRIFRSADLKDDKLGPHKEASSRRLSWRERENEEALPKGCKLDSANGDLVNSKFKTLTRNEYNKDQWSPWNREGKKHYERAFLLKFRCHPLSLKKLPNLPQLEIIKNKPLVEFLPILPLKETSSRRLSWREREKEKILPKGCKFDSANGDPVVGKFKTLTKNEYNEDQWSPWNPEGKKCYDQGFLLKFRSHPLSLKKLPNLPELEIIKDEVC